MTEILLRGAGMIIATIAVGFLTYYGNQRWQTAQIIQKESQRRDMLLQQECQRRDMKAKSLIDITNKQKELEANIADSLLNNLMATFFNGEESSKINIDRKMLQLRLAALNFQDVAINLKPFFEYLNAEILSEEHRQKLRDYAQEVARRQAYRLAFEAGTDFGPIKLELNEKRSLSLEAQSNVSLELELVSLAEDSARMMIDASFQDRIGPIDISYFDMPLVDNLKIKRLDLRLSLLLLSHDREQGTAKVRVVAYKSYMAQDRFDLSELTSAYMLADDYYVDIPDTSGVEKIQDLPGPDSS
jgi:hypothetical protein